MKVTDLDVINDGGMQKLATYFGRLSWDQALSSAAG